MCLCNKFERKDIYYDKKSNQTVCSLFIGVGIFCEPRPLSSFVKCTKYIVLGDYCVRGNACLVVVRLIKVDILKILNGNSVKSFGVN